MGCSPKENASGKGGGAFTKLGGGQNDGKEKICDSVKHTSDIRRELQRAGLGLRNAHGVTQRAMLLRVLQYLGARGINTTEAVGCGYHRVATRIQELEAEGWKIEAQCQAIVGADGLSRVEIARYVLRRRPVPTQINLGGEAA